MVEELEIFKGKVEEILQGQGYENLNTCIQAWKKDEVLDCEPGHNLQKRRIIPNSDASTRVFVFRIFGDGEAVKTALTLPRRGASTPSKRASLLEDVSDD